MTATAGTSSKTIEQKQQANAIVNRRTLYAAGIGLIPIPFLDLAAILGLQVLMIRDISRIYDVDFKEQRVKSIIMTLVGDLGTMGVMSGVKAIPVVGSILGGFTSSIGGAASTYALGKVFTQHFDQGGTLLNFDPVQSRKFFQQAYEEGKLYVEDLSETDQKVKKGWKEKLGLVDAQQNEEIADLRKSNQEMREMIVNLQKSIDTLEKA